MRFPLILPFLALPLALATAQESPAPAVEWRLGAQLAEQLRVQRPWVQLFERDSLTIGRYRLRSGAKDGQGPHDRDEAYYVIAGSGRFTANGRTRDVTAGDLMFVAAGTEHRFHDIRDDLDLLVMFSSAAPRTGGMMAGPRPTEQTPYPETSARGATRIFYWFGPNSAGQVAIDYGRPRWNSRYAQFLDRPTGRRWRFGENFWTTLDTNMRLTVAGVDVPIGMYYVVLQNDPARGIELVLLDPRNVRKLRLDAYEAAKTTRGIRIPMRHERTGRPAARLSIELTVDRKHRDRGALEVTFGDHRLLAELHMHPHR